MEHLQQLETVRRVVQVKFAAYGANNDQGCSETILVRDSHYCGRRFSCDGWRAVWFLEERTVKFFDSSGGFQETLDLSTAAAMAEDVARQAA